MTDDFPDLKIKALVNFPANVIGEAGIDVGKIDGTYHLNLAYEDFAPVVTGIVDPANETVLTWNTLTEQYSLTPISVLTTADLERLNLIGDNPLLYMAAYSVAGPVGPVMYMLHARGTQGSPAAVQNGDLPFGFSVFGYDGTNNINSLNIFAYVDGAVSAGHVPLGWSFSTGVTGPVTRLKIDSVGHLIHAPGSTTPPTLGPNQYVLTPTSNTNMRISFCGSDGITRKADIALAP